MAEPNTVHTERNAFASGCHIISQTDQKNIQFSTAHCFEYTLGNTLFRNSHLYGTFVPLIATVTFLRYKHLTTVQPCSASRTGHSLFLTVISMEHLYRCQQRSHCCVQWTLHCTPLTHRQACTAIGTRQLRETRQFTLVSIPLFASCTIDSHTNFFT